MLHMMVALGFNLIICRSYPSMSDKKPTRKPTGKRKESDVSMLEGRERKRAAKRKGLKAGSRQLAGESGKKSQKQVKDPRIGSRKPVVLVVAEKKTKPAMAKPLIEKVVILTPEQELAAIENDDRLNDLLDRLDAGDTLDSDTQAWVDQRVDRYQVLMDELGIIDNDDDDDDNLDLNAVADYDEPSEPASEEELWNRFNQVNFQPEPQPEPKKK
jgi:ribosome assembly protein YihI (activator of Der GTPase)